MGKVISNLAASVDGFITGRDPAPGRGLGDGGVLHDWYFKGDTPSRVLEGLKLSEPSLSFVERFASRTGATVAGRNTYDDSNGWGGGRPHPTAPLFVVSRGPKPSGAAPAQTFLPSLQEALDAAQSVAGDLHVNLMGGGVLTAALDAGLVDEFIVHQVPVLLGAGRRHFRELSAHVQLSLVEVVPAPGVTHLHYRVER
ncbi:MAG TPA: dihydrofolate reductase family protein [Gaiellaceae bacterium]|nr:dihydrofolate reductase family protein [Gaiellaceae bacterium]